MTYKNILIYIGSLFGYLIITIFSPVLWIQGIYLKKVALRLSTPTDIQFGVIGEGNEALEILGIGESPMAGVGIPKNSETLTALTSLCLSKLMDIKVNWRILAESGLTINNLNKLIIEKSPKDVDLIVVGIGGNDVFNLTSPWIWLKHLDSCVKYFLKDGKTPIILFSAVPCVGRFPAVPKPLRFAFGYWEFLLQKSLILFVNSNDNVFLLGERFPDGKEYFMEDGIHPSKLAYELWSEKLASMSVELLKLNTYL